MLQPFLSHLSPLYPPYSKEAIVVNYNFAPFQNLQFTVKQE